MPPRSEFTALTLHDNKVQVKGKLDPAPSEPGIVHWVVEKDGVTGAGAVPATGADFEDVESEAQPSWRAGERAHAVGVHVQALSRDDGTIEVTSFMWSQRLPLTNAP